VTVQAADGQARAFIYQPQEQGRWPAIVLLMDAMGIRPTLQDMARRLASAGYVVMLPDLYYRVGTYGPFTGADVLTPGPKRDEIFKLYGSLKIEQVMSDLDKYLSFITGWKHSTGTKAGVVGYCMGGMFATAAFGRLPARVGAAACIHGAGLATDSPDSPHLSFRQATGKLYVAVAEIDDYFPDDERQRLKAALTESGAAFEYEDYPGVHHGFAVEDVPVFDKQAAEHHWKRIVQLFDSTLKQAAAEVSS
jgi:carboxymethylenebutenolidase